MNILLAVHYMSISSITIVKIDGVQHSQHHN